MRVINGAKFYEEPTSCGVCPWFNNGATRGSAGSDKGHCIMWDEMHHRWRNPPRRCAKLFKQAFKMPEGVELVITKRE